MDTYPYVINQLFLRYFSFKNPGIWLVETNIGPTEHAYTEPSQKAKSIFQH